MHGGVVKVECVAVEQRQGDAEEQHRRRAFSQVQLIVPLYLLLSGFARGQALGCHAVARADRMQKSMQKHCRDHGRRPVCRSESSASSFNFSPNHWSWRCHLLAPHWAEIDRLASGAERALEIKEKKQLTIADAGAAAAAAQSEGETSSRRACGSRKAARGTQETWRRNGASTYLLECENASSKVALSHTLFWECERKRRLAEAFISGFVCPPVGSSLESVGYWVQGENPQPKVSFERGKNMRGAGRLAVVTLEEQLLVMWPVWGSDSGGCSRSWHTFLVCRRHVCHSPFKKWISFLYLRLGRLPPWPSWEDVKASIAECFHANYPDTFIVLDVTELCSKIRSCLSGLAVAALFFLQEPHNPEGLDWYFPEWLDLLCQWVWLIDNI